ncbi:hypothetical protein HDU79_010581 [Rhizoclosmatium sp. JEL0117]|nr:hypothetical protein HDU79_010581 [Rhizoclosmatium sp. JEL0117]
MARITLDSLLSTALNRRRSENLLRSLVIQPQDAKDFASNDYLGLARSTQLHCRFLATLNSELESNREIEGKVLGGSTGSRLLSGNSATAVNLEAFLAHFHNAETALLFNSGYDANLGLFATLPHPGSSVLYDELVHASVHDGLRQCRKGVVIQKWRHNNVGHLEELVWDQVARIESNASVYSQLPGIIVVVESIYSMDGDIAPLKQIVNLMDKVGERAGGLHLIVDEAHSTGVCGPQGRGLVCQLGLEDRVFARLHTFGKAVGAHGAVVLGSATLREFLVNYARPLVYSTSLPMHSLIAIRCAYEFMQEEAENLQLKLTQTIKHFRAQLKLILPSGIESIDSLTAIQGIIVPGNKRVSQVCSYLQSKGYDVRPIRSPTVPKGSERLRICLHAHNSVDEITGLIREIAIACTNIRDTEMASLSKL